MPPPIPISEELLKSAFVLAENRLMGEDNLTITKGITNEVSNVSYEKTLNDILRTALSAIFPSYSVCREYNRVDICIISENSIITAIESKGMVANSFRNDKNESALDLHGIRDKLQPSTLAKNSVRKDISRISAKIPSNKEGQRFEIFIPIVYELYREGATEAELFSNSKPWTTHSSYKQRRKTLKSDMTIWFQSNYPGQFSLVHSVESIELPDVNQIWTDQQMGNCPWAPISEAYLSFFAFARFVNGTFQ